MQIFHRNDLLGIAEERKRYICDINIVTASNYGDIISVQ